MLIDPRLKPLDKKDLMMIATLGPKPSKTNATKFDYVWKQSLDLKFILRSIDFENLRGTTLR